MFSLGTLQAFWRPKPIPYYQIMALVSEEEKGLSHP